MKKRSLVVVILMCVVTLNYAQQKLEIKTSKSELRWSCDYAFYFGGHYGTIAFKDGYFIKNKGKITGGEFTIDMSSIICTDIENAEANEGLVNHLKNEDFFNVEKFKTAKLVITKVVYHDAVKMKIYASLTIKDITLPVDFQAEVNYKKEQMTTRFKIDRTLWGITYNSKEVEGALKNGLISDAIGFEVSLSL